FLFYAIGDPEVSGIYLASLDGGKPKRLTAADSSGALLKPDRIAFVRQGTLVASQFDLTRGELLGDAVTLANGVVVDVGYAPGFSISAEGYVAYRTGGTIETQLTWFDRTGKPLSVASGPDSSGIGYPQLSPDERRVALYRTVGGNPDIWLLDLTRGSMTRLTT